MRSKISDGRGHDIVVSAITAVLDVESEMKIPLRGAEEGFWVFRPRRWPLVGNCCGWLFGSYKNLALCPVLFGDFQCIGTYQHLV